jgi:hypothetical protein
VKAMTETLGIEMASATQVVKNTSEGITLLLYRKKMHENL